jgi:hypothetical protein
MKSDSYRSLIGDSLFDSILITIIDANIAAHCGANGEFVESTTSVINCLIWVAFGGVDAFVVLDDNR